MYRAIAGRHITAKSTGSRRLQFIATVRKAVRSIRVETCSGYCGYRAGACGVGQGEEMKLYYRLCETTDPEERFEDAAMWKALHDEFGDEITLVGYNDAVPEDGYLFGRGKRFSASEENVRLPVPDYLPYWTDPAFLRVCGRSFKLCDYDEAKSEVARLHADGKDAFIKSIRSKHLTMKVPQGTPLEDALEELAYSFIDMPPCLMVQEFVDMAYERRFVCINREIITYSPIAVHLTPIDVIYGYAHFRNPSDRRPWMWDENLASQMYEFADNLAKTMATPYAIIDLAVSQGAIVPVEFNPLRIGQFGLYACNVREIARAVRRRWYVPPNP